MKSCTGQNLYWEDHMKRNEIMEKIKAGFPGADTKPMFSNQIHAAVPAAQITGFITYLKQMDFKHLVNITCVDWIEDNQFEVVYNVWSYEHHIHITVKSVIDRTKPELQSISSLWPAAQVYEQEIHEMFGVVFLGNPDLGPLFLHNWLDLPPLRKDFDAKEYSGAAYGFVETDTAEATCIVPMEEN